MRIAVVIDQCSSEGATEGKTNGAGIWASRYVESLRAHGHEVRIVATGEPAEGKYCMPSKIFPIIDPLIRKQGMVFGRADEARIREAFTGADIVHLYFPFKLEMRARQIAGEMGIPVIAAFHCQPENVTYNISMKYLTPLAHWLYGWFRRRFYRHFEHIHCPTAFIADQLRRHGYKARLHVVSNGVDEIFRPMDAEKPEAWKDKYVITMVGRHSAEKRQDLIIKAVRRSKYRDSIQLVFPGKGTRTENYKKLARKLKNPPFFGYLPKDELAKVLNQCDLYVHAAEAEIEAITCIEAISCGLVPIISDSKASATKQFALDPRCLFKNKSVKDLQRKIETMMEHPEEKQQMKARYLASAKKYRMGRSVDQMLRIYEGIIEERLDRERHKNDPDAHQIHMPTTGNYAIGKGYRFVNRNAAFTLASLLVCYALIYPVFYAITVLCLGFRAKGRKNLRSVKDGAVTVSNHAHILDAPMVAFSLFPRKPFMTTLKTNFEIPFIGTLVRLLGGVPIPETPKALRCFMSAMAEELKRGHLVHFYPEAALWNGYDELRPFKTGAFHLAVASGKPVLPMVLKFRQPGRLMRKIKKKPMVSIVIGKPVHLPEGGTERERIQDLKNRVHEAMQKLLEEAPA
jgi:1,2-diacylglycerol 3-alpha-glucosyltransferase